ncbi:MAG: o-succinylbenzoate synthase [Acidobacteriota bacterium]
MDDQSDPEFPAVELPGAELLGPGLQESDLSTFEIPQRASDAFTVAEVRLHPVALRLKQPWVTAHGRVDERPLLLVELVTDDGRRAWGEVSALPEPNYLPETLETSRLALERYLIPAVVHRSFTGPAELHAHLESTVRGHRFSKAALDCAAWSLAAEAAGEPLWRLLGGVRPIAPSGRALGFASPEKLLAQVQAAVDAGFHLVKLKIAPGRDLEPLRAVREILPDHVFLAADANCSYRLADPEHRRALAALDQLGLAFLEQPFGWQDLADHARLQAAVRTPLCLDESLLDPAHVQSALALGACRLVNLKPSRVGGLTPSLHIHHLCHSAGIPLRVGGMLESGLGRHYGVALATLPGFTVPSDLGPSAQYWERDLVDPPWELEGGGLGGREAIEVSL